LLVDERVREKLAKNFVEYVGTSEVECIGLPMQRLEAVNQLLAEFFLLRLELQLEVLEIYLMSQRIRQALANDVINEALQPTRQPLSVLAACQYVLPGNTILTHPLG